MVSSERENSSLYSCNDGESYRLHTTYFMRKLTNNGNDSSIHDEWNQQEECKVVEISDEHRDYPEQFKLFFGNKRPRELFCIGNYLLFENRIIMVCGARNASVTGLELSYKCGRIIAEQGITIASGYARGVDMAAHLGALEAGGDTIAILPYGLLKFRVNRALTEAFDLEQFLAVSELRPSSRFTGANALRRNKLLVALSESVIVIEPGVTGGTWFTAKYASKKEKPLFFLEGEKPEIISTLESIGGKRLVVTHGAIDISEICGTQKKNKQGTKNNIV